MLGMLYFVLLSNIIYKAKEGGKMTYQRINAEKSIAFGQAPRTARVKISDGGAVSLEKQVSHDERENEFHRPEIVIAKKTVIKQAKRPIFRRVPIVAALCAVSFVFGCTVTNDRLAETLIKLAAVSMGGVIEAEDTAVDIDLGEPVSRSEGVVGATDVTYLYANEESGDNGAVTNQAEVTVGTEAYGKTATDGEILYRVAGENMACDDVTSLANATGKTPDVNLLLERTPTALQSISINADEPLVLIVHTHATECYNSYPDPDFVSVSTAVRNEDTSENVVGIGEKVSEILNGFGIPTVHSTRLCDRDSFVRAYSVSANEVRAYLEMYPSIRLVIDLHRDAIELADGTRKKPVFEAYGEDTAQLMFVVGTDEAGAVHPSWEENLCLALRVQSEISGDCPGLFRRINLRSASFNQQLSSGYMLLECGSAANTRAEAERAAEIFATGLARVIKGR